MSATAVISKRPVQRWDRGHPWIYRSDIEQTPTSPAGTVEVSDSRGRFAGWALWSPTSEISLRLLDRRPDAVINARWWRDRIHDAAARRSDLATFTTAWRIFHGEADGCPSLICDRYGRFIVVQLMSAGIEAHREDIVAALEGLPDVDGILARNDVGLRRKERLPENIELLRGTVPKQVEIIEHGIRYLA